jgi:Uma2 family endonuclease
MEIWMNQPPRFRWTVDQYVKLIEHGILTENHNLEIIRGELVEKMPKGDLHSWCVRELTRVFGELAGKLAVLSVQDPIYLADSAPEPDIVLLAPRADRYRNVKPTAADALLVVEVADSSLDYDREVKGPLYAENGVAEYWISNIVDRCLEVHRDPRPDGTFAETRTVKPGETITLAQLPAVSIAVSEIIP